MYIRTRADRLVTAPLMQLFYMQANFAIMAIF